MFVREVRCKLKICKRFLILNCLVTFVSVEFGVKLQPRHRSELRWHVKKCGGAQEGVEAEGAQC